MAAPAASGRPSGRGWRDCLDAAALVGKGTLRWKRRPTITSADHAGDDENPEPDGGRRLQVTSAYVFKQSV